MHNTTTPAMSFDCPISGECVVGWAGVTTNGQAYSYPAISQWLQRHKRDPLTGVRLCHAARFVRKEPFASLDELEAIKTRVKAAFTPTCECAFNADDVLSDMVSRAHAALEPFKTGALWRSYCDAVVAMYTRTNRWGYYISPWEMEEEKNAVRMIRATVLSALHLDVSLFPEEHLLIGVPVNGPTFRVGGNAMLKGISFAGAELLGGFSGVYFSSNSFVGARFEREFRFTRCSFASRLCFTGMRCVEPILLDSCTFDRGEDVFVKLRKYGLLCR